MMRLAYVESFSFEIDLHKGMFLWMEKLTRSVQELEAGYWPVICML